MHRGSRRFDQKFIVFENRYQRLGSPEFKEMFQERQPPPTAAAAQGAPDLALQFYDRKFNAEFSRELNRSAKAILKQWME